MKKDYIEIVISGVVVIILIGILIFTAFKFKINKNESNSINDNNELSNTINSDSDSINNEVSSDNNTDSINNNVSNSVTGNTQNSNNNCNAISEVKSEDNVVNYFSSLNSEIDTYSNENDSSFVEKAKSSFITVVDFLFYGSEIKGYTFNELSLSAKLKVLKIAATIDNKIDNYFPNYKDTIKEKCIDLKGKIALAYLETTTKICDSLGEDSCNEARNDFNTMKKSFGYTWDIIKGNSSYSYSKLKIILSEWYNSIK